MRLTTIATALVCLATTVLPARAELLSESSLNELDYYKYWSAFAPTVGDIEAIHLVGEMIYLVADDSYVFAIHADTGTLRWSARAGNPGDRVFRPSQVTSFGGRELTLLSSSTGLQWRDRLSGDLVAQHKPGFVPCAGAISDGPRVFVPGLDGMMHCLELVPLADGRVAFTNRWRVGTGLSRVPPVYWGGALFFVADDGRLRACYAHDKERLWVFSSPSPLRAQPFVDGTGVYFGGTDHLIYKLDVETGHYAWGFKRVQVPDKMIQSPAVIGERMFQPVENHGMYVIDTNSGDTLWTLEDARAFIAATDTRVHLMSTQGEILTVDPADGKIWNRVSAYGNPHVVCNTRSSAMYLAGPRGEVLCAQQKHVPYLRFQDVDSAGRGSRSAAAGAP